MKRKFFDRIGYNGSLEGISRLVCRDFSLGEFVSNKLNIVGYEDFNFFLETDKGKYFVKVFANFRKLKDCKRYIKILETVSKEGVSIPKLLRSKQGYLHILNIGKCTLHLCVMKYVSGGTFFDLNILPNKKEVKLLARQAALINSIKFRPPFVYDNWAITSFIMEWEKKVKYLSQKDFRLVEPLVKEAKNIHMESLPHAFVHGDIIATNVIKGKGKVWVIDFAVSNYYPRIQEMAVLACNLLFDKNSKEKSDRNLKLALHEYESKIHLTEREKQVLPTYIKLAHAMHVLSANYEKVVKNNKSKENSYFLDQGRSGLQMSQ